MTTLYLPFYLSIYLVRDPVPLTLRVYHIMNESTQELNDACVRVLKPKYIKFVDTVNTFTGNITGSLNALEYLDYCVSVFAVHLSQSLPVMIFLGVPITRAFSLQNSSFAVKL